MTSQIDEDGEPTLALVGFSIRQLVKTDEHGQVWRTMIPDVRKHINAPDEVVMLREELGRAHTERASAFNQFLSAESDCQRFLASAEASEIDVVRLRKERDEARRMVEERMNAYAMFPPTLDRAEAAESSIAMLSTALGPIRDRLLALGKDAQHGSPGNFAEQIWDETDTISKLLAALRTPEAAD